MPAKLPLRVSSIILLLFAIGHTEGFLSFRPTEPQAVDVLNAMRNVPFNFGGNTVHWMDLYTGFGLAISVSGVVSAVLAWRLSSATSGEAPLARTAAWLLCVIQVANIVLSLRDFGPIQAVFARSCGSSEVGRGAVKMKAIAHGACGAVGSVKCD